MKLSRTILVEALETALGPADLEHERSPQIAFYPTESGFTLHGHTAEGAGWESVSKEKAIGEPFFIPGRTLLLTLKEIQQEEVELIRKDHELQLYAGTYQAVLWASNAPALPSRSTMKLQFETESNILGKLGALIAYARPKGRSKSIFPGVHVIFGPEGAKIVATDGRRLAEASTQEMKSDKKYTTIVPGRFLLLASKHLAQEQPTSCEVHESSIVLRQEGRGISGTVLAGPMPSYKALLPGKAATKGRIRSSKIVEAIRQARLFSSRVLFQLDEDKLHLTTPESPEGMASITIGVEWPGKFFRAFLSTDELLEAVAHLPGDEIDVEVQGERSPLVLKGEGTLATLMPLLW